MAISDLVPFGRNRGSLVEREGRDPFFTLQRQIDRLFDDFTRGFDVPSPAFGRTAAATLNWPTIDISESDKQFCVEAELAGIDQKDVEVTLRDNVLTIRGEKRAESKDEKRQYSERYFGEFERSIPLNTEVETDKIKATFKNGVLRVEIPKAAQAQQSLRKIPINS